MRETQRTISDWGVQTFGYPKSPKHITDRMLEEVEELKQVIEAGNFGTQFSYERLADECADIYIVMVQMMDTIGYDLHACIDHKMHINRHDRKWKLHGDGTAQHIKE